MNNFRTIKNVFSLLGCLTSLSMFSQVGINTVTPSDGSILDVESSDKGVLLPRLNITDLNTIAPVTGGETQSLLVYNTNATTGEGFHYWDVASSKWIPLNFKDGDFHEVGKTTPPELITQDVYRTGRVGLGKTIPECTLDIENTTYTMGTRIIATGSIGGSVKALYVENSNNNTDTDSHYGIYAVVNNGDDDGTTYGFFNKVTSSSNVNGSTDRSFGIYNELTSNTGIGRQTGTFNRLATGGLNREIRGVNNYITGTGNGQHVGEYNEVRSSGTGRHIGTYNQVEPNGGTAYGVFNTINVISDGDTSYGAYNFIDYDGSSTLTGTNYSSYNTIVATGVNNATNYGTYNLIESNGGVNVAGYFSVTGAASTSDKYAAIFDNGKIQMNNLKSHTSQANADADPDLSSGDLYILTAYGPNILAVKN